MKISKPELHSAHEQHPAGWHAVHRWRLFYRCWLRGQHEWRQSWRETLEGRLVLSGKLTCCRCTRVMVVQADSLTHGPDCC